MAGSAYRRAQCDAPAVDLVRAAGRFGRLTPYRAKVRRAEREITELAFQEPITPAVIRYMDRLSDLLFVLARAENDTGASDVLWHPGAHRDAAPMPTG